MRMHTAPNANHCRLSAHNAQYRWQRYKLHTRLLKYPNFNLRVPDTKQVQRPANVILLAHPLRRVPLNLRGDTIRHFDPLA